MNRFWPGALPLFFVVGGCFVSPDKQYVRADAATYKAVAPYYLEKVKTDERLSEDQKKDRFDLVETWEKRLKEAGGEID